MSNTLQKYAAPTITPSLGGRYAVGTTDGLPGYQPARVGGFIPTSLYAPLRTFIDGEGVTQVYPLSYLSYHLPYDRLVQSPPLSREEITQLIENNLRGQFNPTRPFVYCITDYNVWTADMVQPYVQPVPEIFDQRLLHTWNAGGVTVDSFDTRGRFTFTVDQGAYAVVGIAGSGVDPTDPNAVDFGFIFRQTLPVAVLERGVEFTLSSTTYASPANTFMVEYANGVVNYRVNGTSLRRVVTTPPLKPVFNGVAVLYSGNSRISGIAVTPMSGASLGLPALRMYRKAGIYSLPALRGGGGWKTFAYFSLPRTAKVRGGSAPFAFAEPQLRLLQITGGNRPPVTLPLLAVAGGQGSVGRVALRLRVLGSNKAYATGSVSLPRSSAAGLAGRVYPLGGMVTLPRARAVGTGQVGGRGTGVVRLPALIGRSARYSSAAVRMSAVQAFGYQDPPQEAFVSGAPFGSLAMAPQTYLIVTMNSAGVITYAATAQAVRIGDVSSTASVSSTATATAILTALMQSDLIGSSFEPMSEQGSMTWVVNTDTGASSSYENYAFNSFGTLAGQMYATRSDGVYLLEGDDDAGTPIRAGVSFGETNFGTEMLKRIEYAYIGVASTGTMYLKVLVKGGTEYVFAARRSDDYMAVQRIDIGRGMRVSYAAFEMYNSDGCDFELNTVSFKAAELTRRI